MKPPASKHIRDFIYQPPDIGSVTYLYEDDDVLVVSKPAGLLSVPGRDPIHATCLASYVQQKHPNARIIHRLDMATSGIMVMGLNAAAHRDISIQFEKRLTKKSYIADIWGDVVDESGEVDLPLFPDWERRPLMLVDHENGKPSKTLWRVMSKTDTHTRVLLTPITGRTHQLRVHMQAMGNPILGDEFYAHPDALQAAPRLHLHACDLSFHHPQDKRIMHFHDNCPF